MYRFFVQRNGAYIPFLRTKKRYVYVPFEETVCTANNMYLVQRKAYEETVRMYIPFLCMKKRCVRTISLYEEMVRTVSSYKETVCMYMPFLRA